MKGNGVVQSVSRRRLVSCALGLSALGASGFGAVAPVLAEDGSAPEFRPTDRFALLISNGDYPSGKELPPAGKNLADLTTLFVDLGFDVTPHLDIGPADMTRAVADFGEKLKAKRVDWKAGQGIVLVYFFGHGVEMGGRNILVPAGVDPAGRDVLKVSKDLMRDLVLPLPKGAPGSDDYPGVTIALVDACRVGDVADSGRLTQVTPPKGTVLLFGTRAGRPAISPNSKGENSYFTSAVIETWREAAQATPLYDLCKATEDRCLKRVTEIYKANGSKLEPQYPETSANILGSFVLPRIEGARAGALSADDEERLWREVQATMLPRRLVSACNAFLAAFPQSRYGTAVKARRQGAESFIKAVTKPPPPLRPLKGFLSDDVVDKAGDDRYRDLLAKALRGDKDATMRIAEAYREGQMRLTRSLDRYERWLALAVSLGNGVAFWERHQYLAKDGRQEMTDDDALTLVREEYGYVPPAGAGFGRDSRS